MSVACMDAGPDLSSRGICAWGRERSRRHGSHNPRQGWKSTTGTVNKIPRPGRIISLLVRVYVLGLSVDARSQSLNCPDLLESNVSHD